MPTTLIGLLIFVVLLLPGFAYLVGKERHGTERRASPFRETVAIVAASVTSEIFALALFAIVRWLWPTATPDVGALFRAPGSYLAGTRTAHGHYGMIGIWGLAVLTVAIIVAYGATMPAIRKLVSRLPLVGPYPHDSTVSAWWILFEKWKRNRQIEVGCALDDGSYVIGCLASFNTSADDMPARDLILWPPIRYQRPGADEPVSYPASAVCVTASRIVSMFVGYGQGPMADITPVQEAAAQESALLAAQEPAAAVEVGEGPAAVLQTGESPSEKPGRSFDPSPRPAG